MELSVTSQRAIGGGANSAIFEGELRRMDASLKIALKVSKRLFTEDDQQVCLLQRRGSGANIFLDGVNEGA